MRKPRRRLVRRRFWLLLAASALFCLPFYPPAWHAALRTWLVWQARRCGCDLTITAMDGGLFDTTQLHGLHCRQRGLQPADGPAGTDLFITRVDLTLAWTVPWFQRSAPSWIRAVVLDGVRGRWDLRRPGRTPVSPSPTGSGGETQGPGLAMIHGDVFIRTLGSVFPSFRRWSARLRPETFLLRAEDLRLERGRYLLHATGLWLSGSRDDEGQFMARALTIAGPGFENTLVRPAGRTYWQGSRLTVSQLALGPDVNLVSATLDGSHLDRQRLDCECKLTALGGEVRGQGAVDFSHERLGLDVAATLRGAAVRPLLRLLGIAGSADGLIDQGNLTFRGDPENWPAAQMWLAAHATDFRWGKRRWQDLELQAVIVNRRVQVHRLELRQSANRISLTGECPLPPPPAEARSTAEALRQWREGGFSCRIDAGLEDLRALADLFGPDAPELEGRMSVNGTLSAPPGAQREIDGYLNIEGTRLTLRGAPLDYLRSTLVFKDGGLRVADLQATHDADYFTGTGAMRLDGPPRYAGELRGEVKRLAVYTPALAGLPLVESLARVTGVTARLQWDDSVLRFEEFRGQLDGAYCQVSGTADLRDAAHPALDLAFDGENVLLRESGGRGWARANCALTVRCAAGGFPILGGDVRLLGGSVDGTLEMVPAAAGNGNFLDCAPWLPEECRLCALDFRVTAAAPLPLTGGGEVMPELHVNPTMMAIFNGHTDYGKLTFQGARIQTPAGEWSDAAGAVYFLYGIDGPASLSLLAAGPGGERAGLYGSWGVAETAAVGGEPGSSAPVATAGTDPWCGLYPPSLPLLRAADETPWADLVGPQTLPPPPPLPPRYVLQLR